MGFVAINDVYNLAYAVAAKMQQAFPSPADFNLYAQLANVDLYNYYNDEREKLRLKVKSGTQIYIPTILNNFIVSSSFPLNAGQLSLPNQYEYYLAVTTPSAQIDCRKVDIQKLGNTLNSVIDEPTVDFPIFVEYSDYLQIYPVSTNTANMTYLQVPNTVNWNYTANGTVVTYNPNGTIDYQWSETELYRITSRVLFYMGVSIRDTELEQVASQMIQGAS